MNRNAPEDRLSQNRPYLRNRMARRAFDLPAELLRVYSPSAEVRGSEQERVLQTGKKNVGIKAIEAIGNYAIRITFDDGHDSGIYAWDYLYELGNNQANTGRLPERTQASKCFTAAHIPVGQWQPSKS